MFVPELGRTMAFRFYRSETVDAGIQRLLKERLDCSIERFTEDAHPTDPVHPVRKDIKKMRAILALARPHLNTKTHRREVETLREIAGVLADVRDTQVRLQTLNNLSRHISSKNGIDDGSFAAIREVLEKECRGAQNVFSSKDGKRQALKLLGEARKRINSLRMDSQDDKWERLSEGISVTYKWGKSGLLVGQKESRSEDFHEWRKAVKRLWYQLRLISPAWPPVLTALTDELGRLGECLGDDHDLSVLRAIVMGQPQSALRSQQRKYLSTLIQKRQKKIRREALDIGTRVYFERTGQFCKRMGHYWETWRD